MTQLNYINKPVFDHGAIEQISEVLGGMGIKKPLYAQTLAWFNWEC